MSFQFIDNNAVGASERRLIRSHVMKGKNAGRPRPSRPRPRRTQIADKRPFDPSHIPKCVRGTTFAPPPRQPAIRQSLHQPLWNDFGLVSFPHQISNEFLKSIHQGFTNIQDAIHPPQFCSNFDIANTIWVQYMLFDEAYFHCMLAISASSPKHPNETSQTSAAALVHLSKSYSLINARISGPDPVSNSTIAAVTSLIIYQRLQDQRSTGLIHFDGLCRMIELRGGMAELSKDNRSLAQKPFRLDIELALQNGWAPRFDAVESIGLFEMMNTSTPKSTLVEILQNHNTDARLIDLTTRVSAFINILNAVLAGERPRLGPLEYSEALSFLVNRLLTYAPLGGPRPVDPHCSIVQLALLSFVSSLLPTYDITRVDYSLLRSHLLDALQHFTCQHSQDRETHLWALIISSISALSAEDQCLVLPWLADCSKCLGLRTWPDVLQTLNGFPWVPGLLDKVCQKFWELAMSKNA